jgi:chromosome segregation ATPase
MSTAGKVLTVLILLVSVAWLVLMSAVTQLNVNWEEKIASQQESLDQATEAFTKAKLSGLKKTEETRVKQDETELLLRDRLTKIAYAERARSSLIEDLTRLQQQVVDAKAAAETAVTNQTTREAEKLANEEGLAKLRDQIAKSQATNADLKGQLAGLQEDFKRILTENTAKLAQAAAKQGAAKPVSNVRDSPASE